MSKFALRELGVRKPDVGEFGLGDHSLRKLGLLDGGVTYSLIHVFSLLWLLSFLQLRSLLGFRWILEILGLLDIPGILWIPSVSGIL